MGFNTHRVYITTSTSFPRRRLLLSNKMEEIINFKKIPPMDLIILLLIGVCFFLITQLIFITNNYNDLVDLYINCMEINEYRNNNTLFIFK